jgi:hypothetical protein
MGKKRRTRIFCKIDELPEELREEINNMLYSPVYTYLDIALFLQEKGYDISKSAVGRYALRQNAVAQKLKEAQEQTKALVNVIKQNPETDYTEATMQMLMSELTKKVAAAQEEFDAMDLAEAGRLVVAISRSKTYKDRVKADLMKKVDLAFNEFKDKIPQIIRDDPDLSQRMDDLLEEAKAKVLQDE